MQIWYWPVWVEYGNFKVVPFINALLVRIKGFVQSDVLMNTCEFWQFCYEQVELYMLEYQYFVDY